MEISVNLLLYAASPLDRNQIKILFTANKPRKFPSSLVLSSETVEQCVYKLLHRITLIDSTWLMLRHYQVGFEETLEPRTMSFLIGSQVSDEIPVYGDYEWKSIEEIIANEEEYDRKTYENWQKAISS